MRVIFPILFYFLNTTALPPVTGDFPTSDSAKVIYLVKISWHTGIIFQTDQVDTSVWKFIRDFEGYSYVDVGWGDEAFYQHPGFDLDLAVKALFLKTASTLRVAGFNRKIKDYLNGTDYAESLVLSTGSYDSLCSYIQSFYITENDKPALLCSRLSGSVKFYKSKGWYTVFNTCNTWIAGGLNKAGYDVGDDIILTEQLFRRTAKFGRMVKAPE